MRKPRAYYDPENDSLMIDLADGHGEEAIEIAENVFMTVDAEGNAVALEFLSGVRNLLTPVINQEFSAPDDGAQSQRRAAS